RRRQHHLRIGRDLDLARTASIVGQADAADLAIVLARNQDVRGSRQTAVAVDELGMVLSEEDFVVIGTASGGLCTCRPDFPASAVLEKKERSPVVASRVLPPARHGDVLPAAIAGP